MDGHDERELIEFETPVILAVAFPERVDAPDRLRRCSQCGSDSRALPASELTVIKHRVSNQPLGQLRLYCHEHLADATDEWESSSAGGGHKMGPICPDCFLAVPSGTRRCDSCGEVVT